MCKYCEALKRGQEQVILSNNGHCALTMTFEHERGDVVIDSFVLKAAESNITGIIINYCPICGEKLNANDATSIKG